MSVEKIAESAKAKVDALLPELERAARFEVDGVKSLASATRMKVLARFLKVGEDTNRAVFAEAWTRALDKVRAQKGTA